MEFASDAKTLDLCSTFSTRLYLLSLYHSVLGTNIGEGIIIYQIACVDDGISRIEIGRSKFRYKSSPSFLYSALASLRFIAFFEVPLYYDISRTLGFAAFESDDDDDSDPRRFYFMVRARYRWSTNIGLLGACA